MYFYLLGVGGLSAPRNPVNSYRDVSIARRVPRGWMCSRIDEFPPASL